MKLESVILMTISLRPFSLSDDEEDAIRGLNHRGTCVYNNLSPMFGELFVPRAVFGLETRLSNAQTSASVEGLFDLCEIHVDRQRRLAPSVHSRTINIRARMMERSEFHHPIFSNRLVDEENHRH